MRLDFQRKDEQYLRIWADRSELIRTNLDECRRMRIDQN